MQLPETPTAPSPPSISRHGGRADGIILPLLVLLAVFFGGATQRWSEAVVIGAFSLFLLILPPRYSIGPLPGILALLFLALAAAAFLPAHWFGLPDWRVALTKDLAIQVPDTVSPQPWLTLDSFFVLIAGLAWIYYVAIFDAPLREIRISARLFSGGMILLAALSIYLYLKHQALPSWHNARGFGPFPNRNQTGDLFGISAILVLGCMQDDFRRGHKRWILWLLGFGVLTAALILAFSRAGILILVVGFAAWLIRFAFRKWSGAGLAIAAAPLLLLFAGLLLFGGETIERFHLRLGSEGSVTSDYRWLIFRDAWTMIRNSPWCGLGLGNFESVFALFRHASRGVTRSLHPESDWLWLWAEMGWPALLLILVAAVVFVRRAFPLKEGTNQRIRYAALVGALLFALHGFVDVSGHRFASFMAGTFLLGISQHRPVTCNRSRWIPILFRVVGLILAVVSVAWFAGWRSAALLSGRVGVESARQSIQIANRGHRFSDSIAMADQALVWAPLDWQLYFLRALSRIGHREPVAAALADFRRARFLEPNAYQVPYEEGRAWLGWQPALAITAWREALQREGAKEANIFPRMLTDAKNYDAKVHAALREFARHRPALTINYLEDANPAEFAATLRTVLADDPALEDFTPEQKARLFQLWSKHDPLDELLRQVDAHPDWLQYAWPGVARHRAELGEFAQAWQLVRQYAPPPALPELTGDRSIDDLERAHHANPDDIAVGYALYHAQMKAGKTDDALETARHFTARPDAPNYFHYLEAQAWAEQGNWERAWGCWQDYESGRNERR
jgi:O-antigen ligase